MQNSYLLYCLVNGKDVDIAQIIADELKKRASSSASTGILGYPALITALCQSQKVLRIACTEPISDPIDVAYIRNECQEDTGPPPPPQQLRTPLESKVDLILQ